MKAKWPVSLASRCAWENVSWGWAEKRLRVRSEALLRAGGILFTVVSLELTKYL